MKCQHDFEAHIRSLDGDYNLLKVGDVYIDVETQIEWITWQKAWQAALASQQPADDGWIEWSGYIGDLEEPVKGLVEVRFRNGKSDIGRAGRWYWPHDGDESDIIAYRMVKP